MLYRKAKKESGNGIRAGVEREMAKPRVARSARIAELNLLTARISEPPSVTMPGIVDKIIPSPRPSQPEKAQIVVDGADLGHRDIRIENTLTDENGDDVRLKQGAHVEVTVTAEPTPSTAAIDEGRNLAAEIPSNYSAMNSADRSRYLKLDGFRLISRPNLGDASD
jgi:hypothetical protein